ncbi:MAG: hypothetical protein J5797_02320 [Prevotella sp.]|nr:hypothetical protein [Prevotella sp.]
MKKREPSFLHLASPQKGAVYLSEEPLYSAEELLYSAEEAVYSAEEPL